MGKITLYVDAETEKLLKKADNEISYSQIFKKALINETANAEKLIKTLDKLPDEDEIKRYFQHIPTPQELDQVIEKLEKIKELQEDQ